MIFKFGVSVKAVKVFTKTLSADIQKLRFATDEEVEKCK